MSSNSAKKNPKPPASNFKPKGNPKAKEMIDVAVPSSPKDKTKQVTLPPLVQKPKRNILEDLKKDSEKMLREINQLEKTEIFEKETTIKQLETLNQDISIKTETIKRLSEENQELFLHLKDIRNEVDEKLKLVKIFKVKENQLDKKEKQLQKSLKVIDEELKIAKKNIETYKADKEYYERLVEVHSSDKITPNLIAANQAKNETINNLLRKIALLDKIRKKHKTCEIKQKQLQKELSLIQNEFEFERKRQSTMTEPAKKKHPIIVRYQDANENAFLTLSRNNNSKDRHQRSQSPNKKLAANRSIKKLHLNLNPIHQELNAINESYKKYCSTSVFISQHRMNSDKNIKSVLFKEEEKVLLEKLIPYSKLEAYQRRFEEIEEQKKELEEKIKSKNVIKKIELKENKEKYVSTELQVTEQKKRSFVLNSQRAALTKELAIQKSSLKKLKDNLKFYLDLYKIKQKENEKLFKHLQEIQNQIDSGEVVLKPSEDNDEDEEEQSNEDDEEQNQGQNGEEIEED